MRLTTPLLILALLTAAPAARAQDAERTPHELALTVGYSTSSVSPDRGGLVALAYGRPFSAHWSWLIRPEMVLNLQRPDGRALKGGAFGLDAGAGWQSKREGVRLISSLTIGARMLTEPGVGAVSRAEAGVSVPIGARLAWSIGLSGEVGLARVGDERPKTEKLLRGDLWTRVGASF
jgi:hypothetical protein